jgi:hypothetical protein
MFILDAESKPGFMVYFDRIRGICLEGLRRTKRSVSGLPMFRHVFYINNNIINNVINLTYAKIT